jgi:single-strand DNA-binding protein
MKVYVEGALNTRSWEADDGSKRYRTEVRITDMILLDSKGKQGVGIDEEETPEPSEEEEPPVEDEEAPEDNDPLEEDLPF